MNARVVDASAIAAVLFGEPDAGSIVDRLTDFRLTAPAVFGFELASVCVKKVRAHPKLQPSLARVFALRSRFPVEELAVDLDEVVRLASANALTAYDASYLWLSLRLGAELVTLDQRLRTAFERYVQ